MPVIQTINIISELATKYGLQYTNVLVQGQMPASQANDPYSGKIDADVYLDSDNPVAISPLNTPVFTNIIFKGATYKDPVTLKQYSFNDIEFQTVLLTVSLAKKLVKTEIQGRNGTVKEYIGMDDYQITVNAIINGANYTYPWVQVTALKQMLDAPVPVTVQCKYLNSLGINTVVVENYQIGQEEGRYSQQKITVHCISDTPILLQRLTNGRQS
jgi:hypothetical protein